VTKILLLIGCTLLLSFLNANIAIAQTKNMINSYPLVSTPSADELLLNQLQFGYTDAEAGFNGVHLKGQYPYNQQQLPYITHLSAIGEATFLRGHNFNYQHIMLGARFFPKLSATLPITLSTRAGLLYSSFHSDPEYGILLGSRFHLMIKDSVLIEPGIDFVTSGENTLLFIIRGEYSISDTLSLHAQYSRGDLDELDVGFSYTF